MSCGGDDPESERDRVQNLLMKDGGWTAVSVNVPPNTATDASEWTDGEAFKVTFSASQMTTTNHPTGAAKVWPSTTYTINDGGTEISRGDGVTMTIVNLTESAFSVTFNLPDVEIGDGRVSALGGDYTFNMQ